MANLPRPVGTLPSLLLALALASGAAAQGPGPGAPFHERFALADDRAALLAELLPGTEDHAYYHGLVAQQRGDLEEAQRWIDAWPRKLRSSERALRLKARQALLIAEDDPDGALARLIDVLELQFDDPPPLGASPEPLPSRVPPESIADERFIERALTAKGFGEHIRDHDELMLRGLLARDLDDEQLGAVLDRLDSPLAPGLMDAVLRDLAAQGEPRRFGARRVHRYLTLTQLQRVGQERPELRSDRAWVEAVMGRLMPAGGTLDPDDPSAVRAYLDRALPFVMQLPDTYRDWRVHLLAQRVRLELDQGTLEPGTLLLFLGEGGAGGRWLPRGKAKTAARKRLAADFGSLSPFPPVGDVESLIDAALEEVLRNGAEPGPFLDVVDRRALRRLVATVELTRPGAVLTEDLMKRIGGSGAVERLRSRTVLEFLGAPRRVIAPDGPASVRVRVQNVPDLRVRCFELDELALFDAGEGRDPESLDLTGLVASDERRIGLEAPPLEVRTLDLELLTEPGPGTWIVEVEGGGRAARAVLRRGDLRILPEATAAGHMVTVITEGGEVCPAPTIRFGGRDYRAEPDGRVWIPFAEADVTRDVLVRGAGRAARARFEHLGETYSLDCSAFAPPETLVEGERVTLLVRGMLTTAEGVRAGLDLLEDARVVVVAKRGAGPDVRTVLPFELSIGAGGMLAEVYVPMGSESLEVVLEGTVERATDGREIDLRARSAGHEVMSGTAGAVRQVLLSRSASGHRLEVRGIGGEVLMGVPMNVALQHRASREWVSTGVQSDAEGRVLLGELEGIGRVVVTGVTERGASWILPRPYLARASDVIVVPAGKRLRIPLAQGARAEVSFLEMRGELPLRDARGQVRVEDGWLVADALAGGRYELRVLGTGQTATVQVVEGRRVAGRIVGERGAHDLRAPRRLRIADVAPDGDVLRVRLDGATAATRVHAIASRYVSPGDDGRRLAIERGALREPLAAARRPSTFGESRQLSAEALYIRLRRRTPAVVGNMLERPGVLLDPWDVDLARVRSEAFETGDSFGLGGGAGGAAGGRSSKRSGGRRAMRPSRDVPDYGFLRDDGAWITGLVPGEDGVVEIPLEQLGAAPRVHLVAVDARETAVRTWLRAGRDPVTKDRVHVAVDLEGGADRPSTVARRALFLPAGEALTLAADEGNRARLFCSLEDVFEAFRQGERGATIDRFRFLVEWPDLDDDQKRAAYSEFACHEVHLFLRRKDPVFFADVVRPYLRNKLQRSFMDDYLLDEDLRGHLEPWAFGRLNVVERILLQRRLDLDAAGHAADLLGGQSWELEPETVIEETETEVLLEEFEVADHNEADEDGRGPADSPFDAAEAGSAIGIGGGIDRGTRDRLRRRARSALPRSLGETKEFAEQHYFQVRLEDHVAGLVPPSLFWAEFAAADAGTLPAPFMRATRSRTEMLLALALLDLPFTAEDPGREEADGRVTLRPVGPALAMVEERVPLEDTGALPLLMGQEVIGDAGVVGDDSLAVGVRYAIRVTATNPGPERRRVRVRAEVPAGAVPVARGAATTTRDLTLEPWGTVPFTLLFYVPRPGQVTVGAAVASADGVLLGRAEGRALRVAADPPADRESWGWIARAGSLDEVVSALAARNPMELDLSLLGWRMGERAFFEGVAAALERRQVFAPELWRHALVHGDVTRARRYLEASERLFELVGGDLRSPLASFEARSRGAFEYLSYAPLEAPRVLPVAGRPRIESERFQAQWARFVERLSLAPSMTMEDRLGLTELLILQRRIPEALASFDRIDPGALPSRLQYDYMDAWLRFSRGDWRGGRDVALRHRDHPVERWRGLFRGVLAQAEEIEGKEPVAPERTHDVAAGAEPLLGARMEGGRLVIDYRRLERVEVRYHLVDPEALFSSDPFGQGTAGAFGLLEPASAELVELDPGRGRTAHTLPAALGDADLLIEVRGGGLARRVRHTLGSLSVQPIERFGELRVVDLESGAPLPRAYVKVYARTKGGRVRFHKDGYTDLRGRFDYARRSGSSGAPPLRFVALALADGAGAQVVELRPPAR